MNKNIKIDHDLRVIYISTNNSDEVIIPPEAINKLREHLSEVLGKPYIIMEGDIMLKEEKKSPRQPMSNKVKKKFTELEEKIFEIQKMLTPENFGKVFQFIPKKDM